MNDYNNFKNIEIYTNLFIFIIYKNFSSIINAIESIIHQYYIFTKSYFIEILFFILTF